MRGKIAIFLIFFCLLTLSWAKKFKKPITPVDYQKIMGTGFSTNYFKTTNFSKYHKQNIIDVYDRGFRNLRLRSSANLKGLLNMTAYLINLETVVDDCLSVGVAPVVSWINAPDEANATEEARERYLKWWGQVATKLKDKNYGLSFNLFTELGVDGCGNDCGNSLRENTAKYNNWTASVVNVIRHSGGKNDKRIIILGSPKKTGKGLKYIDPSIYSDDDYMLAEWHLYASGANKKIKGNGKKGQKYWSGDGSDGGKANVDKALSYAKDFTAKTDLHTYFGAWMAAGDGLNQSEVIYFSQYLVEQLQPLPWSLNELSKYYDVPNCEWRTGINNNNGNPRNMSLILEKIIDVM